VANKRNEITAVPALLAGRDLTDTVVTMDALLTQRALAQQIVDQGGHYLMIVKRNQPQLHDTTWHCFSTCPRLPPIKSTGISTRRPRRATDASSYAHWRAPPAIVQPWIGLVRPNCSAAPVNARAEDRQMHRHRDVWYHSCAAD
jgi:hypothetical protein